MSKVAFTLSAFMTVALRAQNVLNRLLVIGWKLIMIIMYADYSQSDYESPVVGLNQNSENVE